ncbi:MAG: proline dehydrogenase family protein [Armatimonadota bacterium]|nr:proline dehydrogenase family protein [Armatimonadota bacterium]MDR7420931.1 proline dehydrogenase family protein [Armatimonadota bacterium]MDR7453670.1 proline dehydrogenase family protein [Armatimonadota bacterium]MDR7456560.1 proline dehydrogenase family protein [Armatimonadota bacterium]MDR7497995.1 proline dehydrogenase family protein [Armatimonadota bacterium]
MRGGPLRRPLYWLSEHPGARAFVLHNPVARRASRRFIAGETLDEALAVVDRLAQAGFFTSLNHLGERTASAADAEAATAGYLAIVERLRARRPATDCYVSVKLTQLGLDLDPALASAQLRRILEAAQAAGLFVRVDMEHSRYVDATLALIEAMRAEGFAALGAVIQAYLYRSEADVDRLLQRGVPIRLVKGAYLEPPEVAYPRMADTNAAYRRIMQRLLRDRGYHAIATHDARLVQDAVDQARREGISPDRFEFQFIYGVGRPLQERLRAEGYRVRVYVPYGTQWYPYFMRRLAERPANLLFLLRNVLRG